MKIENCDLSENEIIAALEGEKTAMLATCADNRVTIRPVSYVSDGLLIYFQTGKDYLKIEQITKNPFVALSVGNFQIEGKAEILGHPLNGSNHFFAEKFKIKHPQFFERYSSWDNEIVVKIEISLVRKWRYIDNKPFLAVWQK